MLANGLVQRVEGEYLPIPITRSVNVDELVKYMKALLLLQLAETHAAATRDGRLTPRLELMLSDAGFGNREVAELLGKSVAATAKAISRGRAARKKAGEAEADESGEVDAGP